MSNNEAYLRVISGPLRGGVFVLSKLSVFELGRGEGCHVKIPDNLCGLTHARITVRDGNWTFLNMNDERPSEVNDIRADNRPLKANDIIRIGDTELQFSFDPPAKTAEEPAEAAPAAAAPPPAAAAPSPAPVGPPPSGIPSYDEAAPTELAMTAVGVKERALCILKVIDGSESDMGREFPLAAGDRLVVGRSNSADVVLLDGKISRNHCTLHALDDRVMVQDLGSSNGTVVNGERVTDAVLKPGDYVRLGYTVLSCEAP